jgi:hypothetical protein
LSPDHEKREALERVLDFVAGLRGPQAPFDVSEITDCKYQAYLELIRGI